jgi:hypothetical protein
MKLAIHPSANSFSDRWIIYCQAANIPYRIVNCYDNNIIDQLADCDALLWHHHHGNEKDIVFAKQLLFSLQQMGMKLFPDFNTAWHFNDKLGQKYLLEKAGVPMVPSFVFYTKEEALNWINTTDFPKVFKLRGGSGSSNVKLVKSKNIAVKIINRAFGKGFPQYNPFDSLQERFRKYKRGEAGAGDLLKGIARFAVPPRYSKVAGRESGYVYFQNFIPGNDHDIRVVVVAGKAYAIKRMTSGLLAAAIFYTAKN